MLKKTVIIVLLSTAPLISFAQNWVSIGQNDAGTTTFYIDSTSIKRNGIIRRAWEIQDLSGSINSVSSYRIFWEFDCVDGKRRSLQFSAYTNGMAKGNLVDTPGIGDGWTYLAPGSIGSRVLSFVCSK